jgi:hypothetical protein
LPHAEDFSLQHICESLALLMLGGIQCHTHEEHLLVERIRGSRKSCDKPSHISPTPFLNRKSAERIRPLAGHKNPSTLVEVQEMLNLET